MAKSSKGKAAVPGRRRRINDAIADWGGANSELLREVIETVTKDGGAIRFGYSRDGGAYAVGVYGDGKPFTEFLPATDDVDGWLEGIRDDYA